MVLCRAIDRMDNMSDGRFLQNQIISLQYHYVFDMEYFQQTIRINLRHEP
eukprot:UN12903